MAYAGKIRGVNFFFDGLERREYGRVLSQVHFSPDGSKCAYVAADGTQLRVYVDGRPVGEPSDSSLWRVLWSPDGKLAILGGRGRGGDERFLSLDGKTLAEGNVGFPAFGAGGRITYALAEKGKAAVIVDGKAGPAYDQVGDPVFSADGKTVAYPALKGKQWRVVAGTRTLGLGPAKISAVALGPDGKAVAWVESTDPGAPGRVKGAAKGAARKLRVVAGGKKGRPFDEIAVPPSFAPDGKTVCYVGVTDKKAHVVIGDSVGDGFAEISTPIVFGPDGATTAYGAREGGSAFMVVGGVRGPALGYVETPVFSPDGKTVAYAAGETSGYRYVLVVGKKVIKDAWGPPQFSADGMRVAHGAKVGSELWWKVSPVD